MALEKAYDFAARPTKSLFHKDIKLTKNEIVEVIPNNNLLIAKDGKAYEY